MSMEENGGKKYEWLLENVLGQSVPHSSNPSQDLLGLHYYAAGMHTAVVRSNR